MQAETVSPSDLHNNSSGYSHLQYAFPDSGNNPVHHNTYDFDHSNLLDLELWPETTLPPDQLPVQDLDFMGNLDNHFNPPQTWPELTDFELNSWALLTLPSDIPMGHESVSSTTTFSQPTNFYNNTLISSDSRGNFASNDINNILDASSSNTGTLGPSRQQLTSTSSPNQTKTHSPPKSTPSQRSTSSSPPAHDPSSKVQKRTLNTLAARRYRQKRVDQMSSLEAALKQSEKEKEELAMRVARLEGEVEVLRGLLKR